MTLLEVVAAIGLLGTLLVGLLMAFRVHRSQLIEAELRREGVKRLENLLAEGFSLRDSDGFFQDGFLSGTGDWRLGVERRDVFLAAGSVPIRVARLSAYFGNRTDSVADVEVALSVLDRPQQADARGDLN